MASEPVGADHGRRGKSRNTPASKLPARPARFRKPAGVRLPEPRYSQTFVQASVRLFALKMNLACKLRDDPAPNIKCRAGVRTHQPASSKATIDVATDWQACSLT